MALGNQGQIGPVRAPTSGMIRLSTLQQNKNQPYAVQALVIGGGGGGGYNSGGGGGAGGVLASTAFLTPGTTYTVVIGAGGVAGTDNSTPGTN